MKKNLFKFIRVALLVLSLVLIIIPQTTFYGVALALMVAGKGYIVLVGMCGVVESLFVGAWPITIIVVVATIVLLNLYELIYSNWIVRHVDKDRVGSEQLERMAEEHITYHFNDEEGAAFCKMIKQEGWTDAQEFREWKYHQRGYYLTCKLFPEIAARFAYVDFEQKQTFKTYLYRIIGNCFFW